jgi:hypothetical protein
MKERRLWKRQKVKYAIVKIEITGTYGSFSALILILFENFPLLVNKLQLTGVLYIKKTVNFDFKNYFM